MKSGIILIAVIGFLGGLVLSLRDIRAEPGQGESQQWQRVTKGLLEDVEGSKEVIDSPTVPPKRSWVDLFARTKQTSPTGGSRVMEWREAGNTVKGIGTAVVGTDAISHPQTDCPEGWEKIPWSPDKTASFCNFFLTPGTRIPPNLLGCEPGKPGECPVTIVGGGYACRLTFPARSACRGYSSEPDNMNAYRCLSSSVLSCAGEGPECDGTPPSSCISGFHSEHPEWLPDYFTCVRDGHSWEQETSNPQSVCRNPNSTFLISWLAMPENLYAANLDTCCAYIQKYPTTIRDPGALQQ